MYKYRLPDTEQSGATPKVGNSDHLTVKLLCLKVRSGCTRGGWRIKILYVGTMAASLKVTLTISSLDCGLMTRETRFRPSRVITNCRSRPLTGPAIDSWRIPKVLQ